MKSQCDKAENDRNPVYVVRDDGTVCCRILPAEKRVEDSPTPSLVQLRTTALQKSAIPGYTVTLGHER